MEQLSFDDLEAWKPVLGYEGIYEVSSLGHVRVLARRDARGWRRKAAMIKPYARTNDLYLDVTLCANATEIKRTVHSLVAEAFHGPRPGPGYQVRHLDGDATNNRAVNLAWGTPAENAQDKIRHGRSRRELSPTCGQGHEMTPENTLWKMKRGFEYRRCRKCHNLGEVNRRRKKAGLEPLEEQGGTLNEPEMSLRL